MQHSLYNNSWSNQMVEASPTMHNTIDPNSFLPQQINYNYEQKFNQFMYHFNQNKRKFNLSELNKDVGPSCATLNHLPEEEQQTTKKKEECTDQKNNLQNTHSTYNQETNNKSAQKNAIKQLKKRLRRKKVKKIKQDTLQRRKELHSQIDKWQREKLIEFKVAKQKQTDTQRVPQVLGAVTKKKHEAKKYISMLESIIQLRKARRIQSGKSDLGESDFNLKINKLILIWTDALRNYEIEETNLRKYLPINEMAIKSKWQNIYFGAEQKDINKMFKKTTTLENFINLR